MLWFRGIAASLKIPRFFSLGILISTFGLVGAVTSGLIVGELDDERANIDGTYDALARESDVLQAFGSVTLGATAVSKTGAVWGGFAIIGGSKRFHAGTSGGLLG